VGCSFIPRYSFTKTLCAFDRDVLLHPQCPNGFSLLPSKTWPGPHVSASAFRTTQAALDDRYLPRPVSPLAEQRNLHRVDDGDALAGPTFDPQHVAMARVVRDCIEPLGAHGLRRHSGPTPGIFQAFLTTFPQVSRLLLGLSAVDTLSRDQIVAVL